MLESGELDAIYTARAPLSFYDKDSKIKRLFENYPEVEREYYYNNAGGQMKRLGQSVMARYQEIQGKPTKFPEECYEGEYDRKSNDC